MYFENKKMMIPLHNDNVFIYSCLFSAAILCIHSVFFHSFIFYVHAPIFFFHKNTKKDIAWQLSEHLKFQGQFNANYPHSLGEISVKKIAATNDTQSWRAMIAHVIERHETKEMNQYYDNLIVQQKQYTIVRFKNNRSQ